MAPQSLKRYASNELTDNKKAKVPRNSQNIRQSKRSRDGADGRMFYQDHVLAQKTPHDGHLQESSQYVFPQQYFQVDPRFRSSPEVGRKIMAQVRCGRPQLQRQICGNDQDCTMAVQRKILYAVHQHSGERVIHEASKENKVQTERRQQADQKEYQMYNFLEPAGRQVIDDEGPLKPSNMNAWYPSDRLMPSQNYQPMVPQTAYPAKSRVTGQLSSMNPHDQRNHMDFTEKEVVKNLGQPESCCPTSAANWTLKNVPCKYSIRIPSHRLIPSQKYQPTVSRVTYPAKFGVTSQLSSVNPHRNNMDFPDQEVVQNLGQPESCFLTSAANRKRKNPPSQPTVNASRPCGHRRKEVFPVQLQNAMEQYLDRWATESTFMEEINSITRVFMKMGFPSRFSSLPIGFKSGTCSPGDSQFHDLPRTNSADSDERSSPEPSSVPSSEYNPHYSPFMKMGFPSRFSSLPIRFNSGTCSPGDSQFHDLPRTNSADSDEQSSPESSSIPSSEYNPHYSPFNEDGLPI